MPSQTNLPVGSACVTAAITARQPWAGAPRPPAPGRALRLPAAAGEEWKERGACRRDPEPDAWFPGPGDRARKARALRVCRRECPVRAECLRAAVARGERGIWGGLTERQRRPLTRPARRPAAPRERPIDTARRLAGLRAKHGSITAAARAARMARTTVTLYLDLLDLDESTQARVQAGTIPVTTAAGAVRAARIRRQQEAERAS